MLRTKARILRTYTKVRTLEEVISHVKPGQRIFAGGFGACGVPNGLLQEIARRKIGGIKLCATTSSIRGYGANKLLEDGLVSELTLSYTGNSKVIDDLYFSGRLALNLVPQGSFAEKFRTAGKGMPAFWTATGANTLVEQGGHIIKYKEGTLEPEIISAPKSSYTFNQRKYIMEESLWGDVALIKAQRADTSGNLEYKMTARNYNADMATAASYVIAEVEEIVEVGQLDPDKIHTPGVYVDAIVKVDNPLKPIEILANSDEYGNPIIKGKFGASREKIARRVAKEVKEGDFINLGIGIPTLVPTYIPKDIFYEIHSENGVLGVDGYPLVGEQDPDLINAGKETISIKGYASFFSSSDSFGIIRGGHLNMTVLGAMQVSKYGDIANWIIPGKVVKGMGGAMDLVNCNSKVVVAMEHVTNKGQPKIFDECTLPLTGKGCVSLIVTDLAVFDYSSGSLTLKEIAVGHTLDEVKEKTACSFECYPFISTF